MICVVPSHFVTMEIDSPTGTRSPIPIIRSPVPTTSQSSAHATAQPHTYTSTVPLPERFQHFHSYNSNSNPLRPARSGRPNSSCSNASSIDEVDEETTGSSSATTTSSSQNGGARRPVLRSSGALEPRPLSSHSYSGATPPTWRSNLSDDHLDQGQGQLSRRSLHAVASFNGTASARVVPMGHSSLSKSWVQDSAPETEAEPTTPSNAAIPSIMSDNKTLSSSLPSKTAGSSVLQQQQQQQLSHRTSTLSPSSTLVSDIVQDRAEQNMSESQESLAKPTSTSTSVVSDRVAASQGL
jgi:hypothetical protein